MPMETIALVPLIALVFAAAAWDVASFTIPNWIPAALALAYGPAALLLGEPLAMVGVHYLIGFGALLVGFCLFHLGAFGGGDAKLLAAACVWTGAAALPELLLWTTLAGGLLAIALIALRRLPASVVGSMASGWTARLLERGRGAPYAVAIAAGAVAAIPALPAFL